MTGVLEALRGHGDRIAVLTETEQVSYTGLADRVADAAGRLGDTRRLVLLETRNDLPTLVHYLAALAGGHVVLPVPAGRDHHELAATYDPDVVIGADGLRQRRPGSAHSLHDELALLLSTSGSTGSPKLVRLSRRNLISNATAIAEYLDIRETDRAATTLPMSYCYGLSVIHSHLLRGAALILTELSVVDDDFWTLFRRHRGTSFAGVPYTFDLLDRIGFATMDLPDLRYLTQAGGRLAPERVRRYAELGAARGWQLFVMYGATEATARMAYLPPELAADHPGCIGRPIPGGAFTIEPLDGWPADDAAGELVYRGDNVMMGYAYGSADLSRGNEVDALHTGDIARRRPDGLYEVIGRSSRFVKMYGLRIDLQRIETALRDHGVAALCTDLDERLVVAATAPHRPAEVARLAADAAGIPSSAVRAVVVPELPMLSTGKPDYPAVRAMADPLDDATAQAEDLRTVFADVLHMDRDAIDPDASFIDLGGNSLTYVAMSVRLERALGRLPADWQRLPLRDLQGRTAPRRRWIATLETSVALRAVAIVLIVGSHATLFELWGGAHVLLGIAGYNFGRFCLTPVPRKDRVRHLRSTIAWIAIPAVVWVAVALVVTDDYYLSNLVLANKILGPHDSMTAGRLWFVEVLVWILVALAALCWIPAADRAERRWPFGVAALFLVAGLALRYDVLGLDLGRDAWFTMLAFWFFAAGWAAVKATNPWQRLAVTIAIAVGLYGYFDNPNREALVLAGFLLLIWLPAVRFPARLTVVAGVIAEASLYTYLTHFQVYAVFEGHPALGVAASIAVGVLLTQAVTLVRRRLRERKPSVSSVAVPAPR
ncbi:AMP-binding protein [Mycolicibacterium litorale]|uniref:AMP-dependent synthetase n=1 Tax=Mycolicibacterium litorale TaxID=758802 RepID=A0AAD1IKQ2_9MYCO|nr:AMP-binding protein [Mycolicibacterium litorale]MCV7415506.1 AMP-binding protein [Mycolicibacterium litorale]TDY08761.1 acyl-CoA synthetase (AMP-forming)/AMP-acid ligase II [Mycolicibacterium litorale]BBY16686.1 AMP-dependent synthetase [Mycolicibacterium litorale]